MISCLLSEYHIGVRDSGEGKGQGGGIEYTSEDCDVAESDGKVAATAVVVRAWVGMG